MTTVAIRDLTKRFGSTVALDDIDLALAPGVTGLLVATVPIFGAITAFALGDRHALSRVRVVGMVVGLAGVVRRRGDARGGGVWRETYHPDQAGQ